MSINVWKCLNCDIYFEPKPPNYKCPTCRGNKTLPAKDFDSEKHDIWILESAEKVSCPDCGEVMANGFLIEKNFIGDLTTLGEGIYWTSPKGILEGRLALKSHACPNCGNVIIKARYQKRDLPRLKIIR